MGEPPRLHSIQAEVPFHHNSPAKPMAMRWAPGDRLRDTAKNGSGILSTTCGQ